MPAIATVTAASIRNFRPLVSDAVQSGDGFQQHHWRRLYPGVLLTREARAEAREDALLDLDTMPDGASVGDLIQPLMTIEFVLWSLAISTRRTTQSFYSWLREHIESGRAFLIDDDRAVSNALRQVLGLQSLTKPWKAKPAADEQPQVAA